MKSLRSESRRLRVYRFPFSCQCSPEKDTLGLCVTTSLSIPLTSLVIFSRLFVNMTNYNRTSRVVAICTVGTIAGFATLWYFMRKSRVANKSDDDDELDFAPPMSKFEQELGKADEIIRRLSLRVTEFATVVQPHGVVADHVSPMAKDPNQSFLELNELLLQCLTNHVDVLQPNNDEERRQRKSRAQHVGQLMDALSAAHLSHMEPSD